MSSPDLKIGILVDNHKVEKFEAALEAIGLRDRKVMKFNDAVKLITLNCRPSRVEDIAKLCKKLQIDFNRSN
jgi:hypothetical protein